jgi:hypothetical protein
MDKQIYIIVSKKCNVYGHGFVSALGHEIHLTRFILFDLLQKNLINSNCTIVTLYEDRFFLYDNTFKNLLTWEDFDKNLNNLNNHIIDLTYYSVVSTQEEIIPEFINLNYNLKLFEKTDTFTEYINNIHFYELNNNLDYSNIIKEKFIVIHWRTNITRLTIDKKENLLKIRKIIDKLKKEYDLNIVIFSVEKLDIDLENVFIINNLQIYASFLNHENCDLFISEWSGGGQLSQYCCNCKIIYYFDNYESHDYEIHYENYQNAANQINNIFGGWDFKSTTKCNRFYYKSLDIMLENLIEN